MAEIPDEWRPLFELLAATGLRISEAIALRVMDADLDAAQPRIHVRRAIVNGQLTGPKSRHGRRTIPVSHPLATRLPAVIVGRGDTELLLSAFRARRAAHRRRRKPTSPAALDGPPLRRVHPRQVRPPLRRQPRAPPQPGSQLIQVSEPGWGSRRPSHVSCVMHDASDIPRTPT
ncbi:MAG: hypothetical protein E6G10_22835 [Actinobacteria bacterium]|nr:MAG: hypothetical protein E6G10_22835 [Actinomycetota bacterium]